MLMPSRFIHPPGLPDLGEWGNALDGSSRAFALNRTMLTGRQSLPRARRPAAVRGPDARWLAVASPEPARIESGVARSRPPDWPAWHQLCGFLELPSHEHEPLSPERRAFLAAGPAPVFMGFGSLMPIAGAASDRDAWRRLKRPRASPAAARSFRRRSMREPSHRTAIAVRAAHAAQRSSSLAARPSCTTAAPAPRTPRSAPACRRSRCRMCRINSRGPRSCSASAPRRADAATHA